jgi:hypothetical protein
MKIIRTLFVVAIATMALAPRIQASMYLYRAYEPHLQRWLNRDPFGEIGFETDRMQRALRGSGLLLDLALIFGGANSQQFVNNDPVNDFDPLGLLLPPGYHGPTLQQNQQSLNNFRNCMNQWLGNPTKYAAATVCAVGAYGAGTTPWPYAGVGTVPSSWVIGAWIGGITGGTVGAAQSGAIIAGGITTGAGVIGAGAAGWGAGTVLQCFFSSM